MSVVFQGCPKLLGHPQYDPRMNLGWEILPRDGHSSTPLVCVSRDSWDTRTILGSSRDGHSSPPPCLSILGFLGYSDDPRIILGWTQLYPPPPPCLSILGFLGYSDDPGIIPGWTQLTPPLSEYPGIPAHGIIPGWTQLTPPLSEFLGFLGYSDV